MFRLRKYRRRRTEIRKLRPDVGLVWRALRSPRVLASLAIAVVFWLAVSSVATLRDQVVGYRPRQYIHQDVLSRVKFESRDLDRETEIRQHARDVAPRVYRATDTSISQLEHRLLALPAESAAGTVPKEIRLDSGTVTALKAIQEDSAEDYRKWVKKYVDLLRAARDAGKLVVLKYEVREEERQVPERKTLKVQAPEAGAGMVAVEVARTFARKKDYTDAQRGELLSIVGPMAEQSFTPPLAANIAGYTADSLGPTHELDRDLTAAEQNEASRNVSVAPAHRQVLEKTVLAAKGDTVSPGVWKLLADEQREHIAQMPMLRWTMRHVGMAGIGLLLTAAMAAYVAAFQPRILRNTARAIAIAALLLAMLIVAQLAAIGTGPLLIFGIAPTILVAMILGIAYDQRFAIGIASLHGLLVTAAIEQGAGFFLVMWLGVLTCCLLLDEVRTRSKPIEVGGAAAVAMILGAAALGAMEGDPLGEIGRNGLYVGAAGLGVGFIVLGILPFIEKAFRITTSMTLLELADVSQPLLRRLAMEAPGTYNHSLQVATLAEAAAEEIGANSLLCRVGSYYHDIGKMHKAEYFCENQFDGHNRHINLTPSVSLLIIVAHVKDGIELAKEYNLPTALTPFIQQHHGTTLVEYFYHQARSQQDPEDGSEVRDEQYRYEGPRPRSAEVGIVMIADAVEGASRAMVEPTANRIETLVHEIIMRRLLDRQFDEADLTFAELQRVERAIVKTVLGMYHGRLAYPSTAATTNGPTSPTVKTA